MLYLIESPAMEINDKGEKNYYSIYKVGYASNLKARFSQYKSTNPYCVLIDQREGTLEDEQIFHYILRGLGLSLEILNEWYKYDSKVKEIFNLPMSDLRKMLWKNRDNYFPKTIFKINQGGEKKEFRSTGHKIFKDLFEEFVSEEERTYYGEKYYITEEGEIISNEVFDIDIMYRKIDERAWEVSQKDYQDSITVTKSIESLNGVTTSEYISNESKLVSDFLVREFLVSGFFVNKMKAYCKFRDAHSGNSVLVDELNSRIRDQKFSRYYEFYGTKGCSSRNYVEKDLIQGLKTASKIPILTEHIYITFKVGDRYAKSEIKKILGDILIELNITDLKPKATMLSDYFEVSSTKITLPDKKVVDGFKINGIKEK